MFTPKFYFVKFLNAIPLTTILHTFVLQATKYMKIFEKIKHVLSMLKKT